MTKHSEFRLRALDTNEVEISIGRETAVLTPEDVTNLIFGLAKARALMTPPALPADPNATAPRMFCQEDMRLTLWPADTDQGGLHLGVGVQGLGWIEGVVPLETAREFQQKIAVAVHDPKATKQ